MLDSDTKRRLDTARDTLVGKVPDPKSQIEQITIAMIYKFMDDMDAESEELGGKRKFFTKEFAKYGWSKILAPGLGGHEMLALYSEGISKMPQNPGIPELFRNIFKNTDLPYRDPETLKSFLKIINEFQYDHSERLGDAFEYLLSLLGSQKKAGQFRTPRHIIDFMVQIISPQKGEIILDPACGTSGFLISAYKYIRNNNLDKKGNTTLTPDDRIKLARNIKGYDIDPNMVRLSLANMYLHGFEEPHIFEYDSLTSEERWNELADVIIANPPFMTPRGGIKPHKRFSIKANRCEVLFMDYISEHLSRNGRAAIIVPEGIVFKNDTAYTSLRKKILQESLVAVVSLPSGCFNPYTPTKTSILILDKSVAPKNNSVAFFKIENDGFSLGAKRNPIEQNDIPLVKAELTSYLNALHANTSTKSIFASLSSAQIVSKEQIAANGCFELSGERFRKRVAQFARFPLKTVESVVAIVTPPKKIQKKEFGITGRFPIIDQSQDAIGGWTDDESTLVIPEKPLVIFGDHTCAVKLVKSPFAQGADGIKILQTSDDLDPHFLYYVLRARPLESDGYKRHYSKLKELEIPLPPLEVQKEIVAEIVGYQKVIDGARAVIDNYSPHIPVNPEWPMVPLGEACIINPQKSEIKDIESSTIVSFVPMSDIGENEMFFIPKETKRLDEVTTSYTYFKDGDILIAKVTPCFENGKAGIARNLLNGIGFGSSELYVLRPSGELLSQWVFMLTATPAFKAFATPQMTGTGGLQRVPRSVVETYKIPLPRIEVQQSIVTEIEAEQALVAANRELITRFEKKIQDTLSRIWGESV